MGVAMLDDEDMRAFFDPDCWGLKVVFVGKPATLEPIYGDLAEHSSEAVVRHLDRHVDSARTVLHLRQADAVGAATGDRLTVDGRPFTVSNVGFDAGVALLELYEGHL